MEAANNPLKRKHNAVGFFFETNYPAKNTAMWNVSSTTRSSTPNGKGFENGTMFRHIRHI
jgi:hypothetical protein